ncbi:MAG: sigma-54-dependent Fis family transcriptional regulator [Labilithrix sp.]|nr:sigma-54-dependent Fis family transcriptional regulator [Labilithrix sp.]
MTRVLFVDDDRAMCEAMSSELEGYGLQVAWRCAADEAFELMTHEEFDVVITDLNMRGMNGIDLCRRVAENRRDVPVIVVTAFGSLETAIATIRAGAFDFITKPFDIEDILVAVERAVRDRSLREEVRRLQTALERPAEDAELVGSSSVMRTVHDLIARVASSDVGVLVTGESGTGKELVARAIHRRGPTPAGPFVAVNCAAIPEALLESELFGHAKGAFTDAKLSRRGLFAEAHGGTLFLDEIGEMPLGMQVKLLRALDEKSVRPIGGNVAVPFEARLVAATNKNLEAAVEEKTFREDLYYRIHVVHIEVPPLRARGGDILELAQYFLRRSADRQRKPVTGISSAVAERFLAYTWPGNVRELLNCVERAVALARFEEISVDDLPDRIRAYKHTPLVVAADADELVPLDELERRYVARVLDAVGGNKSSAARVLGLDRTTLYRMLDRFGLR